MCYTQLCIQGEAVIFLGGHGIMTFADRRQNRIKLVIAAVMVLGWIIYAAGTLADADLVYNLSSPVVSFSAAFLLFRSLPEMGKYRTVGICFMGGIFVWFLGDIAWIFQEYFFQENAFFTILTDNLYIIPDYFYIAGIIFYAKLCFKRNDFMLALVDTFVLSSVAFIIVQRWLQNKNPDYRINFEIINTILYFFATIFLLIFIMIIIAKTGFKNHTKPFYIMVAALFLNIILEIRYTMLLFLGHESENVYLDILYLLFIVIFSGTLSFGRLSEINLEQVSQVDNPDSYIHRRFRTIYRLNSALILVTGGVLYFADFLEEQDVFFIIAVILAYIIMCKTVQTNMLSEELIARQQEENARLERMVEEKTRELREMNIYLEKISNTDALTGLYNRRYGMEYMAKLFKDAENYPVALYSLDLNFFKPINDNFGHDMGDVVLKEVGNRLNHLGESRCTAIRVGGDEFLVIFRNASSKVAIENVGRLICDRMDEPIEAKVVSDEKGEQQHTFQISASIGIAQFPADTMDMDTLFKLADLALYKIKHTHEKSAFLFYSKGMEDKNE